MIYFCSVISINISDDLDTMPTKSSPNIYCFMKTRSLVIGFLLTKNSNVNRRRYFDGNRYLEQFCNIHKVSLLFEVGLHFFYSQHVNINIIRIISHTTDKVFHYNYYKILSLKVRANKAGFNFIISISIFVENCLLYDATQDFLVWVRTGSNPANINRFRRYTGIIVPLLCIVMM